VDASGFRSRPSDGRDRQPRARPFLDGGFLFSGALRGDAATVIEALDLGRPIVVGHSRGTIIASTLAVERPELVSCLVLIEPVYGSEESALSAALDGVRAAPDESATMAWGQFYGDLTPDWLPVWHRRGILSTDPRTVRDALVGANRLPSWRSRRAAAPASRTGTAR
jgi:pimeloyl-ACP methyl ester carboxylesterase